MVTGKLPDSIGLRLGGSNRGIDLGSGGRRSDRDVRGGRHAGCPCGIELSREERYAGLLFGIEPEDNFFLKRRSSCTHHFEDRIEIPQCFPLIYCAHQMRHLVARI